MYTYIIATRREDLRELKRLIKSLKPYLQSKDEILAVQDGGKKIWTKELGVQVISKRHAGIGNSFDVGVNKAKNDYVVLLGSDLIFQSDPRAHLSKAQTENSIVCFGCKALNKKQTMWGADIAETSGGRIYQATWRYKATGKFYQIPCVLGGAYLVKKDWYQEIKGFSGHWIWGSLEPLISLRSYMAGGSCKVYTDYSIVHDFRRSNTRALKLPVAMVYNQLLIDNYFKTSIAYKLKIHSWLKGKADAMLPEKLTYKLSAEEAYKKMKSKAL